MSSPTDAEKAIFKAVSSLPSGFHVHRLDRFINGMVTTTRRGTVKATIEINIKELGSPFDDLRALLNPMGNKMIPFLVFVEPEALAAAGPAERHPST